MTKTNAIEMFNDIEKLLNGDNLDGALKKAMLAIQNFPEEPQGYFLCAEIYAKQAIFDKAIDYLKNAYALSPKNLKFLGRIAELEFLSGDIDNSTNVYQQILDIEPVSWAYVGMGNGYERKGEIAECINAFKQAVKLCTEPPRELLLRLIKLQKSQNDLLGMIDTLHELIEIAPNSTLKYESLCQLARNYYLLNKQDEAISHYILATEINPDIAAAYIGLADAYNKLEQKESEIDILQKALLLEDNYELKQRLTKLQQPEFEATQESPSKNQPDDKNVMLDNFGLTKSENYSEDDIKKLIQSNFKGNDLPIATSLILQSGLFDFGYYQQQCKKPLSITDSIKHFLTEGAAQGLKPLLGFDAQTYRELSPDFAGLTNPQSFVHYLISGKQQKRYYSSAILKSDAATLRLNPEFDSIWYSSIRGDSLSNLTDHEHFLAIGWRYNLPPNRQGFDNELYQACYLDAQKSHLPPFLHYLTHRHNRISSMEQAKHLVHVIYQSDEFDPALYRIQYPEPIPEKLSDILHYICYGVELKLDPNNKFSTEYYCRKYPDIVKGGLVPFIHYLNNGRTEGRLNNFDTQKHIKPGKRKFDANKPTIMVVCHEASRTGAPILGMRLIEDLAQQANIISWNGKEGPLSEDFAESSTAVINNFFDHTDTIWMIRQLKKVFDPKVAIVNSACTWGVALALFEEKIPTVALIHEYGDYMGVYALNMLQASNKVVFPAESVKTSVDIVSLKLSGTTRTNDVMVRHQGRCVPPASEEGVVLTTENILLKLGISEDDEKPFIVFGCGWIQIRKGVECFIDAARLCKKRLKKPIRFIWVGGGYKPDEDVGYGIWLKSQIVNSDLEKEVIFFDETPDLTPFFDLSDVFFLSSRLDPFPNVAIDAADAGVPIVAFERGTGFAEFINANPGVGVSVPFLDVDAAATAICDYATGKRVSTGKSPNIDKLLSFSDYVDYVWGQCNAAIEQQKQILEESQLLIDAKIMNGDFFKSAHPFWDIWKTPEYTYVAMWARGIRVAKSRIGFNDKIAQDLLADEMLKSKSITPLAAVLKLQKSALTHNTLYVDPYGASEMWGNNFKVAVHIHAFYTENLPQLLQRLGLANKQITLFITTDKDEKVKDITRLIRKYSLNATTLIVPNRGRDIGPFIMTLKEHMTQFDIVGHFHLKGTKELSQTVVSQWQNFLYDSLIGKQGEVAIKLIKEFEKNPKLGLLFQEDPCLSGWGKNFQIAKTLLSELKIKQKPADNIEYPTGNMFWVRTAALAPLLKRDWKWRDFPSEPIPYDGSILHAIERLSPLICTESGFEWSTVHVPSAKRYYEDK